MQVLICIFAGVGKCKLRKYRRKTVKLLFMKSHDLINANI